MIPMFVYIAACTICGEGNNNKQTNKQICIVGFISRRSAHVGHRMLFIPKSCIRRRDGTCINNGDQQRDHKVSRRRYREFYTSPNLSTVCFASLFIIANL